GVEVYINGVLVGPQILVRPVDLEQDYTTPQVSLNAVNAQVGPGFDNVVSLKGYNYSADGGGAWMGIDYVALNAGASGVVDTNPSVHSCFDPQLRSRPHHTYVYRTSRSAHAESYG